MKKRLKILFVYIGVILLSLGATIVLCAGFLFFYRDGNIFGIKYISTKEYIYASETEDMSDLKTIDITSTDFDVRIDINPNVESLRGAMYNKTFGYVKKSKAQAKFMMEYDENLKSAVFVATEPKGWVNKKGAYVSISIPKGFADKVKDVVVKTRKGDIVIGGEKKNCIKEINIESKKGDVLISNVEISGDLKLNIGSGKLVVDDKTVSKTVINADLKVKSGRIDLMKIGEGLKLGTVNISGIKNGRIEILNMETLTTSGKDIKGGGKIEIGKVGFVDFKSLDTNLYINNITKIEHDNGMPAWARVVNSGKGSVYIKNANCNLKATTNGSGKIKVETATGIMILNSENGDIDVIQALKYVNANSVGKGDIRVCFSSSALDYVDTEFNDGNKNRAVFITSKDGNVSVDGLQNGNIISKGKGNIDLKFSRVLGENVVTAEGSGNVNIVVPHDEDSDGKYAVSLFIQSKVNADIKVGVAGSLEVESSTKDEDFLNIYGIAKGSITATSGYGRIKIRSTNLIKY